MSITPDNDDARVGALLDRVRNYEAARCLELTESAEKEAAHIIRQAHNEARLRVHRAIADERRRVEREIEVVRARIGTARRRKRQEKDLKALSEAWERLAAALQCRWDNRESRRLWVGSLAEYALRHLLPGAWRVEHPAGWDTNELSPHLPRITAHAGRPPSFAVCPSIAAGLIMVTEGARLDGAVKGLLADRSGIESLLLGEIMTIRKERRNAP